MTGHSPPPGPMAIFGEALELESSAERAAYLDRACAGNPALRARVEALLAVHDHAGDFLEAPAMAPKLEVNLAELSERVGTTIGPYKLLEVIGEGGMGVVYMAEQTEPVRRKVALKIVKPGMDTKQVIARFEAERQALAMMDHPHIARVLDAAATETGHPYFVMELVRGVPITEYCDRERLPIVARLELFVLVCQAVQHAHQKGIIHRDIKPTNVLVTLHDGVAVPKVIDFGVAKATGQTLTEKTLFTGFAQLIGTPLYMSPEQAELSGLDVDTRSDIYSLGVLLYELLAGATPFDRERFRRVPRDEVHRFLREQEPPTPSRRLKAIGRGAPFPLDGGKPGPAEDAGEDCRLTAIAGRRGTDARKLRHALRGELDWITMKAMEKDRQRRYETAAALAADIRRYLADEPLEAGPPSAWYRLRKFVSRNRAVLLTAAVVCAALLVGGTASIWQTGRLRHARLAARQQDEAIRRRDDEIGQREYDADIRRAFVSIIQGDETAGREILDRHRPAPGGQDYRGFEWSYLRNLTHPYPRGWIGHEGRAVYHVEYAPDGRTIATAGADGTARIWDAATKELRLTLRGHEGDVDWVSFDPGGSRAVTSGNDGTVRIWDLASGRVVRVLEGHFGEVVCALFTPDGRDVIAAARERRLVRWDAATGRRRAESGSYNEKWFTESLAISRQGTLALGVRQTSSARTGEMGTFVFHDLGDGGLKETGHVAFGGYAYCVAFAADGKTLAATGPGSVHALVYDVATRRLQTVLQGPAAMTYSLAFAPDGRSLAVAYDNGTLHLWDLETRRCQAILRGHTGRIWCVAFAPDGRAFVTTGDDGTIQLWDAMNRPDRAIFRGLSRPPYGNEACSVAFSAEGTRVVAANRAGDVLDCDLVTGTSRVLADESLEGMLWGCLAPDATTIAVVGVAKSEAPIQIVLHALAADSKPVFLGPRLRNIVPAWSSDGKRLAMFDEAGELALWDSGGRFLGRAGLRTSSQSSTATFLPASHVVIAVCDDDGPRPRPFKLVAWDPSSSRLESWPVPDNTPRPAGKLAISPDGRTLGDARDFVATLREFPSFRSQRDLLGHESLVTDLAFAPDGRTLATSSLDRTVRLWSVATGQELLRLEGHTGAVRAVAFSPDGRALATCGDGQDGSIEVIVWRAEDRSRGDPGGPQSRSP